MMSSLIFSMDINDQAALFEGEISYQHSSQISFRNVQRFSGSIKLVASFHSHINEISKFKCTLIWSTL